MTIAQHDDIDDWISDQPPMVVLDASTIAGAPKRFIVLEPTGDEQAWDGCDPHWFDDHAAADAFLAELEVEAAERMYGTDRIPVGFV